MIGGGEVMRYSLEQGTYLKQCGECGDMYKKDQRLCRPLPVFSLNDFFSLVFLVSADVPTTNELEAT